MTIRRGTLVEITMKGRLFGRRFVIGDSHITDALYSDSGTIIDRNIRVYHAPFDFSLSDMPDMISCFREQDLRIINPDGERLSDKSFEDIMASLSAGSVTEFNENSHLKESYRDNKIDTNRQVKLNRFLR
jgi:hypothetical protein